MGMRIHCCEREDFKAIYGERIQREFDKLEDEFDKIHKGELEKASKQLQEQISDIIKLNDKDKLNDFINQYPFAYKYIDWREKQYHLLSLIKENEIKKVQEFLKDYPLDLSFYYHCFLCATGALLPFFAPYFALAYAGLAYDKSKSFEMLEFLQEYGLKIDSQCPIQGFNALSSYIQSDGRNDEVIKYFLDKGLSFETYDPEGGKTPLHLWAGAGYNEPECLEMALKYGANPNIRLRDPQGDRSYGATPLHFAIRNDKKPITASTEILLKYGAEVNVAECEIDKIENGVIEYFPVGTPLDSLSIHHDNKKLLKKAGAKTWEQLVKKYKIDTNLDEYEQVEEYYRKLEQEKNKG